MRPAFGEELKLRFVKFPGPDQMGQMKFLPKLRRRQRLLGEAHDFRGIGGVVDGHPVVSISMALPSITLAESARRTVSAASSASMRSSPLCPNSESSFSRG